MRLLQLLWRRFFRWLTALPADLYGNQQSL